MQKVRHQGGSLAGAALMFVSISGGSDVFILGGSDVFILSNLQFSNEQRPLIGLGFCERLRFI